MVKCNAHVLLETYLFLFGLMSYLFDGDGITQVNSQLSDVNKGMLVCHLGV